MVFRFLRWLLTPQPRRLADISDEARGTSAEQHPDLGLEATDLEHVAQVNRRNNALERTSFILGKGATNRITGADKRPDTMFKDNDADYARKYHDTFQKGKPST